MRRRLYHRTSVAIVAAVVFAPAIAQVRPPLRIPDDVELIRDVEYGKGGDVSLKLDIIRPRNPPKGPMPVVAYIHGGAWQAGSKDQVMYPSIELARRGFFSVSVEYRFSQVATFPAQIEDCKCAIRWLRAHAKEYNLDSTRIGVYGGSAGGHLVALLGTTGGYKELEGKGGWEKFSSRVQAVVDGFGPSDILNMAEDERTDAASNRSAIGNSDDARSPESRLIGGAVPEMKDQARKASPVTYVNRGAPPFLIIHGDKDPLVPVNQSRRLYDALKKAGVDAKLHVVPGMGHGFGAPGLNQEIVDFFVEHLGKK